MTTNQPEPSLVQVLRAAADWIGMASLDDFDAANPWVDARNPGSREVTIDNLLRAAADRLEAESKGITLDALRTEMGQERDEKAKLVADVARLRDENAKLRTESESLATTVMMHNTAHAAAANQWRDRAEWLLGEMRKEADRG